MATVAIDAVMEGGVTTITTHTDPAATESDTMDATAVTSTMGESTSSSVSGTSTRPQNEESCSASRSTKGCNEKNKITIIQSAAASATPIRKRLGCRRVDDDMITSDDDEEEEDVVIRRKLLFTSPRLMEPDESLFPVNHSPYKNSHQRWQLVSDQAGEHRQDGTVLLIGRKITPMALKIGMTKQAAKRVRSLNLWLDHDKDVLPEWLDVIAAVFRNLEHLTLTEDLFPGEDEMAVSARMRRLYVLYRLPFLKSIDDMIVTEDERRMARPGESGNRMAARKAVNALLDDEDEDEPQLPNNYRYGMVPDESHVDKLNLPQMPLHQQPHLAHEMPVEIIHDQFSHGVVNDGVYGNENDGLGRIPQIPATLSNASARTAKEVGVEINQELAAKFAELNRITTATTATTMSDEPGGLDFDDIFDDELAGEAMLSDLAASSEELGGPESQYSHSLSQSSSGEGYDENIDCRMMLNGRQDIKSMNNVDVEEVDLSERGRRTVVADFSKEIPVEANLDGIGRRSNGVRSQILDTDDNSIELISVASTDVEWTAACGVLSFRTDRSCAPRLRMPFSRNRKVIAADEAVAAIRQAKANVRNKQQETMKETEKMDCTPVSRNDAVKTPQVGCCTFGSSSQGKFFPDRRSVRTNSSQETGAPASANKQLPPSKSLSSPFPMQFRERQKTPPRNNLVVQTSYSTDSAKSRSSMDDSKETIASPLQAINSTSSSSPRNQDRKKLRAGKGDLPPQCPTAGQRKVPIPPQRVRKAKRRQRASKSSTENARSTSVMDLEDDEEEEEVEDDTSQTSESTESSDDGDSLVYSEAS